MSGDTEIVLTGLDYVLYAGDSMELQHESMPGLGWHESSLQSRDLAPWESGGPSPEADCDLFEAYLRVGNADDRDTLSLTLTRWRLITVWKIAIFKLPLSKALLGR